MNASSNYTVVDIAGLGVHSHSVGVVFKSCKLNTTNNNGTAVAGNRCEHVIDATVQHV